MQTVKERTEQTLKQLKKKSIKPTLKNVIQYSIFNPNGSIIGHEEEVKEILKQSEPQQKNESNFLKLQKLCAAVNQRYEAGRNDDDQVNALFKFAPTVKDAFILIYFETYKAVNETEKNILLNGTIKEKKENEKAFYYKTSKGRLIIFK